MKTLDRYTTKVKRNMNMPRAVFCCYKTKLFVTVVCYDWLRYEQLTLNLNKPPTLTPKITKHQVIKVPCCKGYCHKRALWRPTGSVETGDGVGRKKYLFLLISLKNRSKQLMGTT